MRSSQVGGLTPGEFMGAVMRAMFEFTEGVTDLCVAAALPNMGFEVFVCRKAWRRS